MLVVPSILAMQQDVARQMQALRRGLRTAARAPAMAAGVGLAVRAVAAGFAATLGAFVVTGQVWGPVAGLVPMEGARDAFVAFVAMAAGLCLTFWLVGLLVAGLTALVRRQSA